MSCDYTTELKTARQAVRMTQERAAEAAGVSLESWKAYEYGDRLPPMETAARICEALEAPWLALEYLKAGSSPLGVLPTGIPAQELPTAVITLINRVFAFADHHRDRQLLAIAEDGVIDDTEQETFSAITADLNGIIGAALAVKYPRGRPEGIKKNRLDAGTSKRSVFKDFSENDCKNSIADPHENASSIFARRGGFLR